MNKQQLANKIWKSANNMRSKIEASEYKDFILGFIFYKSVIFLDPTVFTCNIICHFVMFKEFAY